MRKIVIPHINVSNGIQLQLCLSLNTNKGSQVSDASWCIHQRDSTSRIVHVCIQLPLLTK